MKNKKIYLGMILVAALAASSLLTQGDASAKYYNYTNGYNDCLAESGGRGHIASVQWACSEAAASAINACSLWIGSSNSVSTVIRVNSLDEVASVYIYGMCTGSSNAARNIEMLNNTDNDSISDGGGTLRLTRFGWNASPIGNSATNLNVRKFTDNTPVPPDQVELGYLDVSVNPPPKS